MNLATTLIGNSWHAAMSCNPALTHNAIEIYVSPMLYAMYEYELFQTARRPLNEAHAGAPQFTLTYRGSPIKVALGRQDWHITVTRTWHD